MTVLELYQRATRLPARSRAFSLAFGVKAPYFLTIVPTLVDLRPNHAAVRIRKWWGVHNHIGTVHVIAIANGLEMAMGALAEATIPPPCAGFPRAWTRIPRHGDDRARTADTDRPTGTSPARCRSASGRPAGRHRRRPRRDPAARDRAKAVKSVLIHPVALLPSQKAGRGPRTSSTAPRSSACARPRPPRSGHG